jgi:magnesium-dependent phosphatase 1
MKDFLFVFDLDFTIWNCGETWCDHTTPPYVKKDSKIFDGHGLEMKLYPDVIHIMEELFHSGHLMAVASRTGEPLWAEDLMKIHLIYPYFHFKELYPGSKIAHFKALKNQSGIPYERMIFFDDEPRNIHDVSMLGVNCILVHDGINYEMYKASYEKIISNELV